MATVAPGTPGALPVAGPLVLSEEVPHGHDHSIGELELSRPLGGPLWWNSLLWTNFPPLATLSQQRYALDPKAELFASLRLLNSDKRLGEQYVTFGAARDDLCTSRPPPKDSYRLTVECLQYEGVRDTAWNFPLQAYIPKRDNHQPHEIQARRFYDNNVIHLGLNAEEFSEKVMPVGDLDACITIADYAGNPTWGYYHCLLRIEGWPFRLKRIGTFEGFGEGGHHELNIGLHYFDERPLWQLLEGGPAFAPTGPGGEMVLQGNLRVGYKYWAQLLDLDWLGPKLDERQHHDPEVPAEKGYVWFTVLETITVPSTGKKGVRVRLLDEGVVPAWLDLGHLRVFAGGLPLGFFSEATAEETAAGAHAVEVAVQGGAPSRSLQAVAGARAQVLRTAASRKVVVENAASRLVFDDPLSLQLNDFVDLGWALFDCCYRGAQIRVGPRQGRWAAEAGSDEGLVGYKASGPPPICHGEGQSRIMLQEPKSDFYFERRLVM